MKSDSTIRRHLRQLRKLIDSTDDPALGRMAYAIECAVRWSREDVVGWPGLCEQATAETKFLLEEIRRHAR